MTTSSLIARLLLGAALILPQAATAESVLPVAPRLETPTLTEATRDADADDPAFWVHPTDPARSLVIAAAKNGGIRVYSLAGAEVQDLPAAAEANGEAGRINNVDVIYGMTMADGGRIDVVVASDRGQDLIRIFRIDGDAAQVLTEITAPAQGRAFPTRPDAKGDADQDNPLGDQMTIYGLTGWRDTAGQVWVAGTQRTNPRIGIFALTATADGTVRADMKRDLRVPFTFRGQDLTQESEDDPLSDWNPQFEGIVRDRVSGLLFAGQEDVGIWRMDPVAGTVDAAPLVTTRGAAGSSFHDPAGTIARDVEGLSIWYGPQSRYLVVSSQGGAHGETPAPEAPWDDSFAVFDLTAANGPGYRGSFAVVAAGGIDAVQESDGADALSLPLPGFDEGVFVTQDGYDNDLNGMDGEIASTNFKFVSWGDIARAFTPPLEIGPGVDPRQ